jgi:hypothetical protein
MTKKINEGSGTLISPELKAVVGRLKEKEPELTAIVRRGNKRSVDSRKAKKDRDNKR